MAEDSYRLVRDFVEKSKSDQLYLHNSYVTPASLMFHSSEIHGTIYTTRPGGTEYEKRCLGLVKTITPKLPKNSIVPIAVWGQETDFERKVVVLDADMLPALPPFLLRSRRRNGKKPIVVELSLDSCFEKASYRVQDNVIAKVLG